MRKIEIKVRLMNSHLEDERFLVFLRYGVWAAFAVHILFGLFFLLIGSSLLLLVNIVSAGLYLGCAWLAKHRHITACLLLSTFEVIAHACLAVLVLGWHSGFHYYIITLGLLSAFHPHWPARWKISHAVVVCFAYLALNQWSSGREPGLEIGAHTLDAVRWFNIAFTFGLLSYLAHYYAKAARDAESLLEQQATTDTLTGLYNRRQMLDVFEQELVKLQRSPRPLSIILVDIDNFKSLNDQFGHECGDNALQAIAGCFRQTLRSQDHMARWGGEEFLLVLPDTDLAGAQTLAEKVRAAVSHVPIAARNQTTHITLTASVGEYLAGEDFARFLARVDQGLLAGKSAGKNRIVTV